MSGGAASAAAAEREKKARTPLPAAGGAAALGVDMTHVLPVGVLTMPSRPSRPADTTSCPSADTLTLDTPLPDLCRFVCDDSSSALPAHTPDFATRQSPL